MSRATWQQGGKQSFSEDRKQPALQILTPSKLQPPSKTRFLRFPGNWNYRGSTWSRTSPPEHFLLVGGNKMAADVSNVKGNLCWCHGQGITSAYSYRMYHLQRIPSTTYSKNQKQVLNSWLNSIYIFHAVFFFLLWFFTKVHFDMPLKENPLCISNRFIKKEKKNPNISNNPMYMIWKK